MVDVFAMQEIFPSRFAWIKYFTHFFAHYVEKGKAPGERPLTLRDLLINLIYQPLKKQYV